jgi:hypothetical protein
LFRAFAIITVIGLTILVSHELVMTDQDSIRTQSPPEKQTYVSEVVLRAPWAEKNLVYDGEESPPGEFGVYQATVPDSLKDQLDAGLPEGPTSFAISPVGDIYITDPLNRRIQRFSPGGQFVSLIPDIDVDTYKWGVICIDASASVYLLCREYDDRESVKKYGETGALLATYPLFEDSQRSGRAGVALHCDASGRLFFESSPFSFQIGTPGEIFSEAQQKSTLMKGVLGANNLTETKLYYKNLTTREFVQYDYSGNVLERFPREIGGRFVGADNRGSIYTKSFTYDDEYNVTSFIFKYDPKGRLLSTIEWNTPFGASWGSGYWWGRREIVDGDGNVYVYWSTERGVTVTKWHRQ